ncbi:MAG: hypothetical protein HGA31_04755 [Candidatus Moranbacteria bacterium]|nr:hypothetical protein [Candidatus Moranbacteria bacterium]
MEGKFHEMFTGGPEPLEPEAAYTDDERWFIGETRALCASVDAHDADRIRESASKMLRELGADDSPDESRVGNASAERLLDSNRYEAVLDMIQKEKNEIGNADHLKTEGVIGIEASARRLLYLSDELEKAVEMRQAKEECAAFDAEEYGAVRSAAWRVLHAIGAETRFDGRSLAEGIPTEYFLEPGRYESIRESIEEERKKLLDASDRPDAGSVAIVEASARNLLELADEMTETLFRPDRIESARQDILTRAPGMIRVAEAMEREAAETIDGLGMELRPDGERWTLEREYYFDIPGILDNITERENNANADLGWKDGDEHLTAERIDIRKHEAQRQLARLPELRGKYADIREVRKKRLEELGIRTDLSASETRKLEIARRNLSSGAPNLRSQAAASEKAARELLALYGAEIPAEDGRKVGNGDYSGEKNG